MNVFNGMKELAVYVLCAVVLSLLMSIVWDKFSLDISRSCEKEGSFNLDNKTYKCEVVK
jgi:hypothetical protein